MNFEPEILIEAIKVIKPLMRITTSKSILILLSLCLAVESEIVNHVGHSSKDSLHIGFDQCSTKPLLVVKEFIKINYFGNIEVPSGAYKFVECKHSHNKEDQKVFDFEVLIGGRLCGFGFRMENKPTKTLLEEWRVLDYVNKDNCVYEHSSEEVSPPVNNAIESSQLTIENGQLAIESVREEDLMEQPPSIEVPSEGEDEETELKALFDEGPLGEKKEQLDVKESKSQEEVATISLEQENVQETQSEEITNKAMEEMLPLFEESLITKSQKNDDISAEEEEIKDMFSDISYGKNAKGKNHLSEEEETISLFDQLPNYDNNEEVKAVKSEEKTAAILHDDNRSEEEKTKDLFSNLPYQHEDEEVKAAPSQEEKRPSPVDNRSEEEKTKDLFSNLPYQPEDEDNVDKAPEENDFGLDELFKVDEKDTTEATKKLNQRRRPQKVIEVSESFSDAALPVEEEEKVGGPMNCLHNDYRHISDLFVALGNTNQLKHFAFTWENISDCKKQVVSGMKYNITITINRESCKYSIYQKIDYTVELQEGNSQNDNCQTWYSSDFVASHPKFLF